MSALKLHHELYLETVNQAYDEAKDCLQQGGVPALAMRCLQLLSSPKTVARGSRLLAAGQYVCAETDLGETSNLTNMLTDTANFNTFFSGMLQIVDSGAMDVSVGLHEAFHTICHRRAGSKVYEVTAGLGELLRQTDMRGLMLDDIRMPYESLLLLVPSQLGFRVWNSQTGWHPLSHIYVTLDATPERQGFRFLCVGDSKRPEDPFDNAIMYFDIPITNRSVDAALEAKDWIRTGGDKEMEEWWPVFLHWAFNAILYITSEKPETEEYIADPEVRALERRLLKAKGTKRERIEQRLRTLSQAHRIRLGASIRPDDARTVGPTVRTRVRGH